MKCISCYNDKITKVLCERENLFKEYAHLCKMNPTTHWVLYTVYNGCERNIFYTQKDLSTLWSFPKQTINTAVKILIKNDLLFLEVVKYRKEKIIHLTQKGRALSEKIMKPLINVELDSFNDFTEEEKELLLKLLCKWVNNLDKGLELIKKELF